MTLEEYLAQIRDAFTRFEIHKDVLMYLIENTGQYTEGYYAMKVIEEHTRGLNRGALTANMAMQVGGRPPEEVLDALLLLLNNVTAAVESQIGRLE